MDRRQLTDFIKKYIHSICLKVLETHLFCKVPSLPLAALTLTPDK